MPAFRPSGHRPPANRGSLRDPLWHFVVLGAGLFALQRATTPAPGRVVVTAGVQRALRAEHEQRYGAPPSPVQAQALVERWIDDEVRVREAVALGLERDDLIVRRRLIQKMDFLLEDASPLAAPTDADLTAWMAARPADYARPDQLSFEHVFAATDRHPHGAAAQVARWQTSLRRGTAPATLGDPFLRGAAFQRLTPTDIAGIFGAEFMAIVTPLPVGVWSEPVRSSYGWHCVRINERIAGGPAVLADARAPALRDWRDAQRARVDQAALKRLRRQYEIVTETPPP